MSSYHFGGLNIWAYSLNRSIVWLGLKDSHYMDRRHLTCEFGSGIALGLEVIVGGENRDVSLRIGLLITTIYLGVTDLVHSNKKKLEQSAKRNLCYTSEVDFADQGRRTGVMLTFGDCGGLEFNLWNNSDSWTNRSLVKKFRYFPYCEGARKKFYFPRFGRG